MTAEQERLRVADAARQEWAEATAAQADAARQAQDELRRREPEVRGPGPEAEPKASAVDPEEAGRWRQAQAERAAEIREQNRTLAAEPQAGRETPAMDPAAWRELKAAQTARVEAEREGRRVAAARAVPVTEEEIRRYGPGAENTAEVSPEAEAALEGIQAHIEAAWAEVTRRAEAEAGRDAEASISEFGALQAAADAQAAAAWEPGTRPSDPPAAARQADTEADAGIEL
jgi:hypothetical protein